MSAFRAVTNLVSKQGKKKKQGKNEKNVKRVRFKKQEAEIIPPNNNNQRSSSTSKNQKVLNRRYSMPIMKKRGKRPILGILKTSKNKKQDDTPQKKKRNEPNASVNRKQKKQVELEHNNREKKQVVLNNQPRRISLNESVSKLLGYNRVIVNKISKIEERQISILENPAFSNSEVKISSMFLTPNGSNIVSENDSSQKTAEINEILKLKDLEISEMKDKIRSLQEDKIKHLQIQSKIEKQLVLLRVRLKVYETSVHDLEADKETLHDQLIDKERIIGMLQKNNKSTTEEEERKKKEKQNLNTILKLQQQIQSQEKNHENILKKTRNGYEQTIKNLKREKIQLLRNYKKMKDNWSSKLEKKSSMQEEIKSLLQEKEFKIGDQEEEIIELRDRNKRLEIEIKEIEKKLFSKGNRKTKVKKSKK